MCGISQARRKIHNQAAFGGQNVYPHEHPWQVQYLHIKKNNVHVKLFQAFIEIKFKAMIARERCGGSLITRDTIISAAHCFLRYGEGDILLMPEFVEVTLGEHNIASISPTKIEKIYRISNTNIEIHFTVLRTMIDGHTRVCSIYLDYRVILKLKQYFVTMIF